MYGFGSVPVAIPVVPITTPESLDPYNPQRMYVSLPPISDGGGAQPPLLNPTGVDTYPTGLPAGSVVPTTVIPATGQVSLTSDQLVSLLQPAASGETFAGFLNSHVTGQLSLTTLLLIGGAAAAILYFATKGGK